MRSESQSRKRVTICRHLSSVKYYLNKTFASETFYFLFVRTVPEIIQLIVPRQWTIKDIDACNSNKTLYIAHAGSDRLSEFWVLRSQ